MESDASSYVLFPYTAKHSPYCGITGTRLFPKDYSMQADNVGNADFIAVVISASPFDYNLLNEAINNASGTSYQQKVNNALGEYQIANVDFNAGTTIDFSGKISSDKLVSVIMQIDKQ